MKRWSTADDERVCDICESLDGVSVGLDGDFPFPTSLLVDDANQTPPAHPRCRCALVIDEIEPVPFVEEPPTIEGEMTEISSPADVGSELPDLEGEASETRSDSGGTSFTVSPANAPSRGAFTSETRSYQGGTNFTARPANAASTSETRSNPNVFSIEIIETPDVRIPDEEPGDDQRTKPRIIDVEILSVPNGSTSSNRKKLGDYLRADGTMDWDKAKKDYKKFLQSVPIKNRIFLEQSIDAVTFKVPGQPIDNLRISFCPESRHGLEEDVIYYDTSNDAFARIDLLVGLTHELAHRIDHFFAQSNKEKNFMSAIEGAAKIIEQNAKMYQDYSETQDKTGFVSDCFSAFCEGKYSFEFGHSRKYWLNLDGKGRKRRKTMETFANIFSMEAFQETEHLKFLSTHFLAVVEAYANIGI